MKVWRKSGRMYAKICKSFNQKMLDEFNKKIGRKIGEREEYYELI